jgi:hypothetical protein
VTVGGRHLAPASVAAIHHDLNIALLRTALPTNTAPIGLTPSQPVPRSWLTAIGYPGGERATGAARVPFRAILVPLPDERAMVRGVARPAMSGSPLVDGAGQVAGILLARGDSARPDAPAVEARLGMSADELALAVPAPWMRAVASVAGLALPTGPGSCRRRLTKRRPELAVVQVLCTNE